MIKQMYARNKENDKYTGNLIIVKQHKMKATN